MKASELIIKLQEQIELHGDLNVAYLKDKYGHIEEDICELEIMVSDYDEEEFITLM